jgi:hypothetical protein
MALLFKATTDGEIKKLFNDGHYWDRAFAGEFMELGVSDRHPSMHKANENYCTISQMVEYRDKSGSLIALVHQYRRTDGKIGASGKPDPKKLRIGDIIYYLDIHT